MALPGAYTPANIALWVRGARKPHPTKVAVRLGGYLEYEVEYMFKSMPISLKTFTVRDSDLQYFV
jgi:hypothetical protein